MLPWDLEGNEGRWIDVPRLQQQNDAAPSQSSFWSGRAAAAMIYNFWSRQAQKTDEYIGHCDGDVQPGPNGVKTNLRWVGGANKGVLAGITDGQVDLTQIFTAASLKYDAGSLVPAGQTGSPEQAATYFAPIIEQLKANNPVLLFTLLSRGPGHVIVISGYKLIGNGELWIRVTDSDAPRTEYLPNCQIITNPASPDKMFSEYWIPATALFQSHPTIEGAELYAYVGNPGKFMYVTPDTPITDDDPCVHRVAPGAGAGASTSTTHGPSTTSTHAPTTTSAPPTTTTHAPSTSTSHAPSTSTSHAPTTTTHPATTTTHPHTTTTHSNDKMTSSNIFVGGKHFVDWFNQDLRPLYPGNHPTLLLWKKPAPMFPANVNKANFVKVFDNISQLWAPQLTVPEFLAFFGIFYNETGGSMQPIGEVGSAKYMFNATPGGKASYNTGGNRKAGDQLAGGDGPYKGNPVITDQAQIDAWNGTVYPDDASDDVKKAALQCDFYKYRGHGFIQTTFHNAYVATVNPALQAAGYGKTCDDMTMEELENAIKTDPKVSLPMVRSYYKSNCAKSMAALSTDPPDWTPIGTRISGQKPYGQLYQWRCQTIYEAMQKAGITMK